MTNVVVRSAALVLVLSVCALLCAGCSTDHVDGATGHEPNAISDVPFQARALTSGTYRLGFTVTGALQPLATTESRRVDMSFVVSEARKVMQVVSVTSSLAGALLQATSFPDQDGHIRVLDYRSCRLDADAGLPTELTPEALLTDSIGPLPEPTGNGRYRTSIRQDDGEVAVAVRDDAGGRLADRTVVQVDHISGETVATITAISLRRVNADAGLPGVPRPTMCPRLLS